jgi:two-component system chemotaxis response regulator CheY
MEGKPEIREEGENYVVIIPKNFTTIDHLNVFISNIIKSKNTESQSTDFTAMIEKLRRRWPEPAASLKNKWAEMRVLVIDDQSTIRGLMKGALKEIGFVHGNIDDANDGKPALQKLLEARYDLIISDWNMPEISGLDLLKIVKAVPGFAKTRFVMVTSQGAQKNVMEAINHGINGYIIKPFTTAHVEKTLQKIITV